MSISTPVTTSTTVEEVLERVRELIPFLRANAEEAEELRRVPDKNIEALADAGVFLLTLPKSRGGFEATMAEQNEIFAEIARGCPSTGWVATILNVGNWLLSHYPDEGQEEIFATSGVRSTGVFAPTGKGARQDGGYLLNGRWAFNTGAPNAQWAGLTAMCEQADGSTVPYMLAVPYSELEYADDWYASGMAGSGSRSTIANDVFVPDRRALAVQDLMTGNFPHSTVARTNPYFQVEGMAASLAASGGGAVGIARGALDVFLERLPGRGITYTDYTNQAEAPITHLQVGEAKLKLFSAEAHLSGLSSLFDDRESGALPMADRAAIRAHLGYATQLSREVVDILFQASGASAIQRSVPIQRYQRDMEVIALHGLMQPTSSTELFGRVALGLEPNTTVL